MGEIIRVLQPDVVSDVPHEDSSREAAGLVCSHQFTCGRTLTLESDATWIKATVKVGNTVWREHKFLAMDDLPDISDSVGQKIDGILGEDVLQEFTVIQIDLSNRQLLLSH